MKTFLCLLLSVALSSVAAEPARVQSIEKGVQWLLNQQQADGSFANPANPTASQDHPALTALPLIALHRSGLAPKEALRKGYAFLRSKAQPDGGIYVKGLSNYNTSVALVALLGTGDPQDEPLITRARAFVAGQQAKDMAKPELNGGFGYGPTGASPKRQHPDLDNTLVSLQALAAYKHARPNAELAPGQDLDWKAAIDFVTRCQNLPEKNPEPWASGDPANRGGAVYYPGFSNAGEQDLGGGKKALRSYGTMSYAALLSFIYADLPKDDPRVTAALDWLVKNYTTEENPGLGRMGLYYYYHLAVRGLSAAGVKELTTADGRKVDWERELQAKILSLQQPDGSWVNDTARWMETDPVLVTSYCLLALEEMRGGER
jgi:squalene-hopene/tetraprenyl-beta-curcumene cyclase